MRFSDSAGDFLWCRMLAVASDLQSVLVRSFMPGEAPRIVKANIHTPSEAESTKHQLPPALAQKGQLATRRERLA